MSGNNGKGGECRSGLPDPHDLSARAVGLKTPLDLACAICLAARLCRDVSDGAPVTLVIQKESTTRALRIWDAVPLGQGAGGIEMDPFPDAGGDDLTVLIFRTKPGTGNGES